MHETELLQDSFAGQVAQAATAYLQVLSASVMDMLQAGIHEKQVAAATAPVSSVADNAAVISNEVANQASLGSDAAAASSPESTAEEAASQSARSCIFEVEVVLTITGTKIHFSVSGEACFIARQHHVFAEHLSPSHCKWYSGCESHQATDAQLGI